MNWICRQGYRLVHPTWHRHWLEEREGEVLLARRDVDFSSPIVNIHWPSWREVAGQCRVPHLWIWNLASCTPPCCDLHVGAVVKMLLMMRSSAARCRASLSSELLSLKSEADPGIGSVCSHPFLLHIWLDRWSDTGSIMHCKKGKNKHVSIWEERKQSLATPK